MGENKKMDYRAQMDKDLADEIARIEDSADIPAPVKATAIKVLQACSGYETGGLVENCGGYTIHFGLTLDEVRNWYPKGGVRIEADGTLSNAWDGAVYALKETKLYKNVDFHKLENGCGSGTSANGYDQKRVAQLLSEGYHVVKGQHLPTKEAI